MITDDITINLSPYLGCSKHLIEFFAIIGYEEEVIKSFGMDFMEHQDQLELTILSIDAADISYEIATDYIIKQVYPDKPTIKENERPPSDSIIFSSCIDSVNGDNKIFYSCYAFRFYEKIKLDKKYYVPKAFLIYSQYPYFSCFSRICEKIYDNTNYGMEFPVEIFVHCLVNYFPSSLNNEIILTDFEPQIIIPKLTGYPHVDFNLPKVINCVGLIEFIKIYILIFLELDLLFFSPDLEKLNILMFALYILNYPLTDSNYFWHIKTISVNDLAEGDDTISTSFKGVNSDIIENLDLSKFKVLNFIIDLENEKEPILSITENRETTEIKNLLKYINSILKNKKNMFFKKTPFSEAILNLKNHIKPILKEYNDNVQDNPKIDDFFYINDNIFQKNKAIQEIFYDFILNMLVELNKDYTFDPTFTFPLIKKINDNPKLCEEEKLFLKFSRNTIKYSSYFQFLSDFKVYDGLKLSLLCSDEFVNLKKKGFYKQIEKEKKISYFAIMDEFFTKKKLKTFDLNALNEEYSIKNFFSIYKENKSKNLLKFFTLKKDIIKKFVYTKKNKNVYKSLSPPEDVVFERSTKSCFHFTIQNYFTSKISLLKTKYYLRGSCQYIIATCIPLFSEKKLPEVINEYLLNTQKMQYFERYYIFLILKAINKYRRLNLEKNTFPEMNSINTQKYFQTIQSYLKDNSITQDEIIFKLFKKINNIQEKPNENQGGFSYICDDKNFTNNIKNNLIFGEKIILFRRNNNDNIEFQKRIDNQAEIPSIFQESYSYYESCYEANFDIIKLDVSDIAERIVNVIGFYISLYINDDKIMLNILFYLLNCLMYYRDKVAEFNNQN